MLGNEAAEELLEIEEADAWFEYLEGTRGYTGQRYEEAEPWAWAKLQQSLRTARSHHDKLRYKPTRGQRTRWRGH